MKPFNFHIPTKIIFGQGTISKLNKEIGPEIEKIVILTDVGLAKNTTIPDRVVSNLPSRDVQVLDEIQENPGFQLVEEVLKKVESYGSDLVIGLGGGSAMDAAKWVAHRVHKPVSLICIPTTAGTGSEVTPFAVFTDEKEETKTGLSDPAYFPALALIDPELTHSMPHSVALNTGLDVLAHAVEAYLSEIGSDLTDGLALRAIDLVLENLERAVGKENAAMENMSYAAMLAGMAITQASTILPHIMGYPLTVYHQVPHGRAGILMLPPYLDHLQKNNLCGKKCSVLNNKFAEFKGIKGFLKQMGVSNRLADYGVKESELDNFVGKVIVKGDVAISPGKITEEVIHSLYRSVLY